ALGTSNAIAWALQTERYRSGGASVLHAYDAVNLQTELYNSERTGLRDQAGAATKFTLPTGANGQGDGGPPKRLKAVGLFPENTVPPDASPWDLEGVSPLYFQAALTWANHATNATGIKIERSSDGETFVQVNIVPRTATSYTDSGLRGSSVYFYRIRATNQV